MASGQCMKIVSTIILVLYLLQPLACFANPCDSSLGNSYSVDTADNSGSHTHSSKDADSCDSSFCCAEYIIQLPEITAVYAPSVSVTSLPESYQQLPTVVIPIFIPPQNFA